MESQVTKSKIINDPKDETEKKRKGFLKKDSLRNVKESLEENDVIIINNVQDLEKDMKSFVEKMEKQLLTHHSLISAQRLKFREILSKLSLILDQKDVTYEKFHHFFKNLNISYLLTSQKSLKGSELNPETLNFLTEISDSIRSNGQNTKNAVLVESDSSHKNTKIHVKEPLEKKSIEKKSVKREREEEISNENMAKIQKKRKTNKISNGTQPLESKVIEETSQVITQSENKNAQNHQQNMSSFHNNNMAAMNNNYKFMNNFNHFLPNTNFENANMLAQKMMTSNGNFLQFNDVINNKNMLSMNKN